MSPATSSWSFSPFAPANDNFNNGQFLDEAPHGWWSSHNVLASRQGSEPASSGECTVWFFFYCEHAGNVTFTIDRTWGNLENVVLSAYHGFPIGSLVLDATATGPNPSITFANDACGTNGYSICVGGLTTADQGGFVFSWNIPPAASNYTFDTAVGLSGGSATLFNQNGNGAMREFGDIFMDTADSADATLWYRFHAVQDGFFSATITPPASESAGIALFRGTEFKDLQLVAYDQGFNAPQLVGTPVTAGDVIYVEAFCFPDCTIPLFTLSHAFTTDVGANFYEPGEIQSNSPGSFTTFEVNPGANHPRRGDWHYVSFYVNYGSADRPPTTGDGSNFPSIFQMRNAVGDEIWSLNLYGWYEGDKFQSQIFPRRDPTVSGRVSSVRQVKDQPLHVEIMLQIPDSAGYVQSSGPIGCFFIDGVYIGKVDSFPTDPPTNGLRYIDVGQVSNPASWPLDLRYNHIRVVNMRDYPIPPPDMSPTARRIVRLFGFENNTTASEWINNYFSFDGNPEGGRGDITELAGNSQEVRSSQALHGENANFFYGDTPGRGRGIRMTGSSLGFPFWFPGGDLTGSVAPLVPTLDYSWWLYVDAYPTTPVQIFNVDVNPIETGTPATQYDPGGLFLFPDGTIALRAGTNSQWSRGTYVWSGRKVELNTWCHLELAFDLFDSPTDIRWWMNGEEQPVWTGYRNQQLKNNLSEFVGDYGPGWGRVTTGVAPGGSCWVTDVAIGIWDGSPIGPVKSTLIHPDHSGTHVLGVAPTFFKPGLWPATEQEPYSIFTTPDDGVTNTQLNPTDPVHPFLDEWPPVIGGDWVGMTSWGTGVYIEFGYQAIGSGETILGINCLHACRGFHMNYEDVPPLLGGYYTDFQPTVPDYMPMNFWWLRDPATGEELATGTMSGPIISDGGRHWYHETAWVRGFSSQPWTPAMLNSAMARWGERGLVGSIGAPESPGVLLYAAAIEVMMEDSYPALTSVGASPNPLSIEDFFWNNPESTLDSCMGDPPTGLATDPNMKNAVWRMPAIDADNTSNFDRRRDVEWYWRVTPAQNDQPGFDGSFHDTNADRLAGTTSFDVLMGDYFPIMWDPIGFDGQYLFPLNAIFYYPTEPEGSRWGHAFESYWFTADTRIRAMEWIFNPCRNTLGKIGTDRTVVIEFYARDTYGKTSPTTSMTYTINKGLCCDVFIPQIYRIIKTRP